MPPKGSCIICSRADAAEIDAALLDGKGVRATAIRFGLPERTLARHNTRHMRRRIAEVTEASAIAALSPEQLLARVSHVEQRALQLCKDADSDGSSIRDRATAIRELRSAVELLAKLTAYVVEQSDREPDAEYRPDIDAAIMAALTARGVAIEPGQIASDDVVVEAEIVGD